MESRNMWLLCLASFAEIMFWGLSMLWHVSVVCSFLFHCIDSLLSICQMTDACMFPGLPLSSGAVLVSSLVTVLLWTFTCKSLSGHVCISLRWTPLSRILGYLVKFSFSFFLSFFFWQDWGLNSGLWVCKAGTPPWSHTTSPPFLCIARYFIVQMGLDLFNLFTTDTSLSITELESRP
jgi:hypothetical protein